jgi:hypothetical protein
MHQVYGFVLFFAGLVFIALSAYLLIEGHIFDFGGIVLVAGAALFGFLLCVTGYRMFQKDFRGWRAIAVSYRVFS